MATGSSPQDAVSIRRCSDKRDVSTETEQVNASVTARATDRRQRTQVDGCQKQIFDLRDQS